MKPPVFGNSASTLASFGDVMSHNLESAPMVRRSNAAARSARTAVAVTPVGAADVIPGVAAISSRNFGNAGGTAQFIAEHT